MSAATSSASTTHATGSLQDPTKLSSWVTEAQDAKKTPLLFSCIYGIYLLGRIVVLLVANALKKRESQAEKDAKCSECPTARSRILELEQRVRIAELSAREANSRAEEFAMQVRRANELAEEFQRRAMAAEEQVGDWRNFEFSANEVGSLHSPQTPSPHSAASSAQSRPNSLKTQSKLSRLVSWGRSLRRRHKRSETLEAGQQFSKVRNSRSN
ncbi:hypothetical protein N7489_002152 [Penicillium chrysogenum]|uniref:Endoplasmic reticulum transmembrane protein n=1 Tax=Penicillium chrysogenum TaxID=5076 RepID=A0ABQ8WKU8_PENCH|nr:uncharacterized protein N7489_002152 [Penicillium chrysogenum]KAJ5251742.1 hypothetical protein N7489_002152 [Penicillium chrysogenum]KAJ5270648.1 hypothetical protein N7505_006406 [Penicillium chrysogenum]KAJ6146598.1 hypothetical protein N7497_008580 [Penicillium chrysogenum]